ncbi:hypothetical protein FQA39_LY04929 [Lamprigera yunnana]|nr:hypothetical protein FQA39_LY04929 [Lamprigera yunnana]
MNGTKCKVFSEDGDEDISLTDRIQLRKKCVRPNLQQPKEDSVSDCSHDKDKDVNADICLICENPIFYFFYGFTITSKAKNENILELTEIFIFLEFIGVNDVDFNKICAYVLEHILHIVNNCSLMIFTNLAYKKFEVLLCALKNKNLLRAYKKALVDDDLITGRQENDPDIFLVILVNWNAVMCSIGKCGELRGLEMGFQVSVECTYNGKAFGML